MKIVASAGVIFYVLGTARIFADDQPTSLADARASVEANLKTAEGKAYDERIGKRVYREAPVKDEVIEAQRRKSGI
ncbi:MAG TPA: hypothetical protein VNB49_18610 [Candidatus Dormibacteraeota bacterium]|nr:hypothetical protein [Candidatus Dormibacteraeota bacterium]